MYVVRVYGVCMWCGWHVCMLWCVGTIRSYLPVGCFAVGKEEHGIIYHLYVGVWYCIYMHIYIRDIYRIELIVIGITCVSLRKLQRTGQVLQLLCGDHEEQRSKKKIQQQNKINIV